MQYTLDYLIFNSGDPVVNMLPKQVHYSLSCHAYKYRHRFLNDVIFKIVKISFQFDNGIWVVLCVLAKSLFLKSTH